MMNNHGTNQGSKKPIILALTISMVAALAVLGGVSNAMKPAMNQTVVPATNTDHTENMPWQTVTSFAKFDIEVNQTQAKLIQSEVLLAINETCAHGSGNSKVKFAAIEIADRLALDVKDNQTLDNIRQAIDHMAGKRAGCSIANDPKPCWIESCRPPIEEKPEQSSQSWKDYFKETLALNTDHHFLDMLNEKGYSPVKISWEDIGRYENSAWGDRISDVGIWVRETENDVDSAQLALSVRRDNNFRDKVLLVPADKIKVHLKQAGQTVEQTLPERLKALGLSSANRDKNVIVSNQFAVVPVPAKSMRVAGSPSNKPPRAAFNFSIYPYGSTNYVITDVIEGSADAIVGPGNHQLLYSNVNGKKAPFTASRAEDRQDLLKLEADLKKQGMDVDVQRYYLIQVPLKKGPKIALANMGTPPRQRHWGGYEMADSIGSGAVMSSPPSASPGGGMVMQEMAKPSTTGSADMYAKKKGAKEAEFRRQEEGLTKVAIGHGETEGAYRTGAGFRGQRADEPIRVTVVYFVTPVGEVTAKDMQTFTKAFDAWDKEALWGGSFVVKDQVSNQS